MRYAVASLAAPPTRVSVSDGCFHEDSGEWIQPAELWSAIYYHHGNAVTINASTMAVETGDVVVVPPGARMAHSLVGAGTEHSQFLYNLPGPGQPRRAIPCFVPGSSQIWPEWKTAAERTPGCMLAGCAFAWQLLWTVSCELSVIRGHESTYTAEEWILANLQRRFSVKDVCEAVGVSQRQLLRLFRMEHGTSVQEYVLSKRVQEATRLLMNTNLSVKQVATRVGFNDLQHFNKVVRDATGSSPRRFKDLSATVSRKR